MQTSFPHRLRPFRAPRAQRGIALFVGMVFLIVLSLVAVVAMQSTFLEMRMSTNVARHEEAFQMSDSMRGIMGPLIQNSLLNGGWPSDWGGSGVTSNDYDFSAICGSGSACPMMTTVQADIVDKSKSLTRALDVGEKPYDPTSWVIDLAFNQDNPNGAGKIAANISVIPDGVSANQGAGEAQAAGYQGRGHSIAAGGHSNIFQVQSVGLSPADSTNGRADTIVQYSVVN